jgi:hypothetical protein
MAEGASTFLRGWMRSYVDAGSRGLGLVATAVEQCVTDAAANGYTRDELETASGGLLSGYIRASIIKSEVTRVCWPRD